MAKKKKVEKPKRKLTRRQLSHWQRQKRRQRLILGISISVVFAALALVSLGVYQCYLDKVEPLGETVAEVNGTKFNMDYYIKALKFQVGDQYTQYVQYFLDPILENIQQNELIRQEALAMGISVSDDEVDEELKNLALPVDNPAVRDIVRAQLLITKLEEEYFEFQVPVSAEQRHIIAMFLESQSQVTKVVTRLIAGENFGELASELSLDSLTKEESGDLGWRPRGVLNGLLDTSIQELEEQIFSYPMGVVSYPIFDEEKTKNVGYWLVQVLERTEEPEEAHVQVMLLSSEEEAQDVLDRLERGEGFFQLAEELSQWWSSEEGADMGWVAPGDMGQAFDDFVFNPETELNTTSEPIRDESEITKGGYWLFKVLESDTREISEEDRDVLVAQVESDWLVSLWDDPENSIISYLDDEMRTFAISKFIER